jgi:hypothetical protein
MKSVKLFECAGKVGFVDRTLALAAAVRKRGRGIYRCSWCGLWHTDTDHFRKHRDEPFKRANGIGSRSNSSKTTMS